MRGSALVGLACAIAGCVPIDPFRGPPDADPNSELIGLAVKDDAGDPVEVYAAQFRVRFATTSLLGARFPEAMELGGLPVLGEQAPVVCDGDDRIGIRLTPAFTVSATHPATLDAGEPLQIEVSGPAHVVTETLWELTFACGGSQVARGTTRFSFFPDGRIVRSDGAMPAEPGPLVADTTPCGCATAPADPFWFTSYIALRNNAFAGYRFARINASTESETGTFPMEPGPNEIDPDFWISNPNPIWACLGQDGTAPGPYVGVVWSPPASTENNGTRMQRDSGSTGENSVLKWDWLYASGGSMAVPGNTVYGTNTAMFVGTGPASACDAAAMQSRAAGFNNPPTLALTYDGGFTGTIVLDRSQGVYAWYPDPAIAPTSYELRTNGPIPSGYALSVLLPGTDPPTVARDSTPLRERYDYLWQVMQEQQDPMLYFRHTLWFRRAWTSTDEVLTITQP